MRLYTNDNLPARPTSVLIVAADVVKMAAIPGAVEDRTAEEHYV